MGVQSTLSSITITIDPNLKKKYQLYYKPANTPTASTPPKLLTPTSPDTYQVSVSSDQTYEFTLFEVDDKGMIQGIIAIMISSVNSDKTGRVEFYMDKTGGQVMNMSPDMFKPASSSPMMLTPYTQPQSNGGCSSCPPPSAIIGAPNAVIGTMTPAKPASAKLCGWHYIVGQPMTETRQFPPGYPNITGPYTYKQILTLPYTWHVVDPMGIDKTKESYTAVYTYEYYVIPGVIALTTSWSWVDYPEPSRFHVPCTANLQSIDVKPGNKTIKVGEQEKFKAIGNFVYSDDVTKGTWEIIAGWKSGDIKIASVFVNSWWYDGAHVTGVGPGITSIIAESPDNKGKIIKGEATLEVKKYCWNYTPTGQRDSGWGNKPYDTEYRGYVPNPATQDQLGINLKSVLTNDFYTIGEKGCALTDYTIILNSLGVTINGQPITPDSLNQWLLDNGGFIVQYDPQVNANVGDGFIRPKVISDKLHPLKTTEFRDINNNNVGVQPSYYLDSLLDNCIPVMVGVKFKPNKPGYHYVVVTGKKGNDYDIIDPYYPNEHRTIGQNYNNRIYSMTTF